MSRYLYNMLEDGGNDIFSRGGYGVGVCTSSLA